jgi:hypothetical protein
MDPEVEQYIRNVIHDAWRAQGASPHAIAGVMANIRVESNFDPTLRHFDQPGYTRIHGYTEASNAHGLYQEGADEWNNYAAWLQSQHPGADWRDPTLQSQFAAWNLKNNYPGVWSAMNNAQSPAEAASHYVAGYLKPAPQYLYSRLASFRRNGVPDVEQWLGGQPAAAEPEIDYSSFGVPEGGAKSSTPAPAEDIDYSAFGKPADDELTYKSTASPPGASQLDANGNEIVSHSGGVPGFPKTPPVSNQSGLDQIRMDAGVPDPKSKAGQPAMTTIGIRGYADAEPTNIKGFPANSPVSMRNVTTPPSVTVPRRVPPNSDSGTPDTSYGHGGSGPGTDEPNQINPLKVDDAGYSSIADVTQLQRQIGKNADWGKFEREARPSTNVEDKREPDYTAARHKREDGESAPPQFAGEPTFANKDAPSDDLSDLGLTMPKGGAPNNVPMPRARPASAPQRLTDDEISALPGTEVPYDEYAAA